MRHKGVPADEKWGVEVWLVLFCVICSGHDTAGPLPPKKHAASGLADTKQPLLYPTPCLTCQPNRHGQPQPQPSNP